MHFEALDRADRRDHPKPFNNFGESGCAPAELFLVKIVIRQSRLLWFSLFRDFLAIGSWESPLHSHGAKIGTKITRAGLHHSLLDGSKLFSSTKNLTCIGRLRFLLSGINAILSLLIYPLVRSEKLYCVCWILQFGLEEFRIYLNVLMTSGEGDARPVPLFPVDHDNSAAITDHAHICKFNRFKHHINLS